MVTEKTRVDAEKLVVLASKALQSLGVPEAGAQVTANVLVSADLRGVETHGIASFIPFYITGLREGRIKARPDIKVTDTDLSVATVDGDQGLGFVVAHRAMTEAIQRARKTGAGFVSVRNSTHFGPGFYYAMMAIEHDMIGITMTSPIPEVVAPGSSTTAIGTNPLSVAVPSNKRPPFVLDMATSVVAGGKLRKAILEGKSIPEGWAIDKEGKPLTDPTKRVSGEGGLLPLGGTPILGSYKGFGLGVLVEILCALLSGTAPGISRMQSGTTSHFMGALRIGSFLPVDAFKQSMDELIAAFEALPKLQGVRNIYVAGGYEAEIEEERKANGIPFHPKVLQDLKSLAEEVGIKYDL